MHGISQWLTNEVAVAHKGNPHVAAVINAAKEALTGILKAAMGNPYHAYWVNMWLPPPPDPRNPRAPLVNQLPPEMRPRPGKRQQDTSYDSYYSDDGSTGHEPIAQYRQGGYHPAQIDEEYGGCYVLKAKLGWGRFSTVWLALDKSTGCHVAVKFQKANASLDAVDEIAMLSAITAHDKAAKYGVVQLVDHFTFEGPYGQHVAMVYELLGDNLLKFIEQTHFLDAPPNLSIIQHISRQCLIALNFMQRKARMVHTDIKPENVVFVWSLKRHTLGEQQYPTPVKKNTPLVLKPPGGDKKQKGGGGKGKGKAGEQPGSGGAGAGATVVDFIPPVLDGPEDLVQFPSALKPASLPDAGLDSREARLALLYANFSVKIVDLGNCHPIEKPLRGDIQTCQYRAPEVLLGLPYNEAADTFSMACLFFELLTGEFLFDPEDGARFNEDVDHLVQMEQTIGDIPLEMKVAGKHSKKFFNKDTHEWKFGKPPARWPLKNVLAEKHGFSEDDATLIADFLLPMLAIDPAKRATPFQMLSHPFVQEDKYRLDTLVEDDLAWEVRRPKNDDDFGDDADDEPEKKHPGRRIKKRR